MKQQSRRRADRDNRNQDLKNAGPKSEAISLKPRPRLFIALLIAFFGWLTGLLVMYLMTMRS
jgi:hypothetical protein